MYLASTMAALVPMGLGLALLYYVATLAGL